MPRDRAAAARASAAAARVARARGGGAPRGDAACARGDGIPGGGARGGGDGPGGSARGGSAATAPRRRAAAASAPAAAARAARASERPAAALRQGRGRAIVWRRLRRAPSSRRLRVDLPERRRRVPRDGGEGGVGLVAARRVGCSALVAATPSHALAARGRLVGVAVVAVLGARRHLGLSPAAAPARRARGRCRRPRRASWVVCGVYARRRRLGADRRGSGSISSVEASRTGVGGSAREHEPVSLAGDDDFAARPLAPVSRAPAATRVR